MNKKKKLQGLQDDSPKLDALRFSPEISFLCDMLHKKLKKMPVGNGV
jgi:hypothetical protein